MLGKKSGKETKEEWEIDNKYKVPSCYDNSSITHTCLQCGFGWCKNKRKLRARRYFD